MVEAFRQPAVGLPALTQETFRRTWEGRSLTTHAKLRPESHPNARSTRRRLGQIIAQQSVRRDRGTEGVSKLFTRPAKSFRQSRSCGCGRQFRPATGSGLAFGAERFPEGNAPLRPNCHRASTTHRAHRDLVQRTRVLQRWPSVANSQKRCIGRLRAHVLHARNCKFDNCRSRDALHARPPYQTRAWPTPKNGASGDYGHGYANSR
jgi:hypothetical protein